MTSVTRATAPRDLLIGVGDGPARRERPPPALHAVDVVEDAHGWRLVFEVPGTAPDTVPVEVQDRVVVVRGDRPPDRAGAGTLPPRGACRRPLRAALWSFRRRPTPTAPRASYVDGLLTLAVPRAARRPRTRTIPIRAGPDGESVSGMSRTSPPTRRDRHGSRTSFRSCR